MSLINAEVLKMAAVGLFIFFIILAPFATALYRRRLKGIEKWSKEDSWTEIEFGGQKYPIRQGEVEVWELMNRRERREYTTTLATHIKKGRLKWIDDYGTKRLIATEKGRDIEFGAIYFYKQGSHDNVD